MLGKIIPAKFLNFVNPELREEVPDLTIFESVGFQRYSTLVYLSRF